MGSSSDRAGEAGEVGDVARRGDVARGGEKTCAAANLGGVVGVDARGGSGEVARLELSDGKAGELG